MRPAEPCRVLAIEYVISDDGHDYTLPSLTLVLADEASPLKVGVPWRHGPAI